MRQMHIYMYLFVKMKGWELSQWVHVQDLCVENLGSLQEVTLLQLITELATPCFEASPVGHCQNQDGSLL